MNEKTYEVRDGARVLGTYSSKAKADSRKKELKAQGIKTRVAVVYGTNKTKRTKDTSKAPEAPQNGGKRGKEPKPKKVIKRTPAKPKVKPAEKKEPEAPADGGRDDRIRERRRVHPDGKWMTTAFITDLARDVLADACADQKADASDFRLDVVVTGDHAWRVDLFNRAGSRRSVEIAERDASVMIGPPGRTEEFFKHWMDRRLSLIFNEYVQVLMDYVPKKTRDVNYAICGIRYLAEALYAIQEAHLAQKRWYDSETTRNPNPVLSVDEIEAALNDPAKAVPLCKTYLGCYIAEKGQYWGGWDEDTISFRDWDRIRTRLNDIMKTAKRSLAPPRKKPVRDRFAPRKKALPSNPLEARRAKVTAMAKLFGFIDRDVIPIGRADFEMMDSPHIMLLHVCSQDGKSIFGLDSKDGLYNVPGVDINDVLANFDSYYTPDGMPIEARFRTQAKEAPTIKGEIRLDSKEGFAVDASAFERELKRAVKIVGKKAIDANGNGIRLYREGQDLFMAASSDGIKQPYGLYGMEADVGEALDDSGDAVSLFSAHYLSKLAAMMKMSETTPALILGKNYPLRVFMKISGFDVICILAPLRRE